MTTAIGSVLTEIRQQLPLTEYLASKGHALRQTGRSRMLAACPFPEPFVRRWRIGYAPPKSPQLLRNLLKQHQVTPQAALASGVVVEVRSRDGNYVRDFFGNGGGYIIFPNPGCRGVVDLQGRAFPDSSGKPKYLNLPKGRRHLFNE